MMVEKSSALILNDAGQLLVVRKRGTSRYILPGGKLEKGESSVEALIREIHEELGVDVLRHRFIEEVKERSSFEDYELKMRLFSVEISGDPVARSEIAQLDWVDADTTRTDLATGITRHALPYLRAT